MAVLGDGLKVRSAFGNPVDAQLIEQMLAAAFGLEHSSRARLVVKPDETPEDPAARYLAI
jgi:hypothetical protein